MGLVLATCAFAAATVAAQTDIRANNNRSAAGKLEGGVLTLAIETGVGTWRFDGDDQPGVPMQAFAEVGGPLQIPGPLVRVPAGTEIQLSIRHTVAGNPLVMHGLIDRPAASDTPIEIRAGETRTLGFRLSKPGTYYYWGSTTGKPLGDRFGFDSQLSGAIVVDPPGVAPDPREEIFVITEWLDAYRTNGAPAFAAALPVFNGRSWPATERLHYTQGETIRWRWINLSFENHPMHLHGFYFRINSRGDLLSDKIFRTNAERQRVATDWLQVGETRSISWVPERVGDWVFHCHNPYHMRSHFPLDMLSSRSFPFRGTPEFDKALESTREMGGLVFGATIHPRGGKYAPESKAVHRKLVLTAEEAPGSTAKVRSYRYVLGDPPKPEAQKGNPPIVLTRGQPVEITIRNRLPEMTTVHWHGIELESYYDGVAEFGGDARRRAPMIHPGHEFVARFTPPRAGTFIYHTHMNDVEQQEAGLAGPLIVLKPGETYNPGRDHIILFTTPPDFQDQGKFILVNGINPPQPMNLKVGVRHRLRFINLHSYEVNLSVDLKQGPTLAKWRALAKDGRTLPAAQRTLRAASQVVSLGETYDFEFVAKEPGEYKLEMANKGFNKLWGAVSLHAVK